MTRDELAAIMRQTLALLRQGQHQAADAALDATLHQLEIEDEVEALNAAPLWAELSQLPHVEDCPF